MMASVNANPRQSDSNTDDSSFVSGQRTQSSRKGSSRSQTKASRPSTARSARPSTARSELADIADGQWVCAVLESRKGPGVPEVGIAAADRETGRIVVTQLLDSPSYLRTTHHLALHPPVMILVPDSAINDGDSNGFGSMPPRLTAHLQETFANTMPIKRSAWQDRDGLAHLNRLIISTNSDTSGDRDTHGAETRESIHVQVQNKYYALSALCARQYTKSNAQDLDKLPSIDSSLNRLFPRFSAPSSSDLPFRGLEQTGSIKISYEAPEGTTLIDVASIRQLELVTGSAGAHRNDRGPSRGASLCDLLSCQTPMGVRMLKASILQPLTSGQTINARLDAVQELLDSQPLHHALGAAIHKLGESKIDIDRLIPGLLQQDGQEPLAIACRLKHLVNLGALLIAIRDVAVHLEHVETPLLRAIHKLIVPSELDDMAASLQASLNDDLFFGRSSLDTLNAKIYAVKADYNPLLDVARSTYKENLEDIIKLSADVAATYALPLKLKHNANGYLLELSAEEARCHLPVLVTGFVNVTRSKSGKVYTMSTLALKKLNQRLADSLNEVLLLSSHVVSELCLDITANIAALYKASESVALLDLLCSLADRARSLRWVRPEFTGKIAIRKGVHPLLACVRGADNVVPNDAFADEDTAFFLVTGPNMSGKTTYLKQIALLTIMASIGSFVPAEYASFKHMQVILTRFSNADDTQHNLSTFACEMSAAAAALSLATPSSLVLFDELGRGTSPLEGLGIAHAVCEKLLSSGAVVFFATHFLELQNTLRGYRRVSTQSLQVQMDSSAAMMFKYRVQMGVDKRNAHYGLQLAKAVAFPPKMMDTALEVSRTIGSPTDEQGSNTMDPHLLARLCCIVKYDSRLTEIAKLTSADTLHIAKHLLALQGELTNEIFSITNKDKT